MKIGTFEFNQPLILAPMAGLTNIAFRELAYDLGADFAVSELIMGKSLIYGNPKGLKLLKRSPQDIPFIIQLGGPDAETFIDSIPFILGANADILDINVGCPVKKVTSGGSGSALMKNPDEIYRIISELKSRLEIPVTVKIRLGWDHDSLNYKEVAKGVERAGADMVAVHRRTRAQLYGDFYPESVFEEIRDIVTIPLVVNGEIKTYDDIDRMFALGADGVMIGREAIKNPWIFNRHIAEITPKMRYETLLKHIKLLEYHFNPKGAALLIKKFYGAYIREIKGTKQIRNELVQINDYDILLKRLEEIFRDHL